MDYFLKAHGFIIPNISDHYDDLKFLKDSGILLKLIGLHKSSDINFERHTIYVDPTNLFILKDGKYETVASIRESFEYKNYCLYHKETKKEWIYLGDGLVEKTDKLRSVAELTDDEMETLLTNGRTFHEDLTEERSKKLTCALQIVMNPRKIFFSRLFKNANTACPVHCTIRLIKDKMVHSTGLGVKPSDKIASVYKFVQAELGDIDWEEFRNNHEGRLTTTIAIDSKQAESALNYLNELKKNGLSTNGSKRNCASIGVEVLEKIGIDLNIKTPLFESIWKAVPSRKDIPVINSITDGMIWLKDAITPNFVKKTFSILGSLVYIPKKMFNMLPTFNIQHPAVMADWMLQKKSTYVRFRHDSPDMLILPPQNPNDRVRSDEKIAEWKEIYQG